MALSSVAVQSVPIGALTSKPYAFTARSWELRTTNSIDISDGLFSRIRVDHRGGKVMRILPRFSETVNQDWISDKARHYLDALQTKRVTYPTQNFNLIPQLATVWSKEIDGKKVTSISSRDLRFAKEKGLKLSFRLTWNEMANQLVLFFLHKSKRGWGFNFWSGENTDNEGLLALKEFGNIVGPSNLNAQPQVPTDLLDPYIISHLSQKIDQMDVGLFIGTNLRTESPVLNARVRRLVRSPKGSKVVIGVLGGNHIDLTYNVINLGGISRLVEILEGQSTFCNILSRAKNPLILVGQSILNRADGAQILEALRGLSKFIPNLEVKVLSPSASTVGSAALNVAPRNVAASHAQTLNYFVGTNPSSVGDVDLSNGVSIYQGSHFDTDVLHRGLPEDQHQFDFVLPTLTSTEKNATYYSMEGHSEKSSFVAFPGTGQMRSDWTIFQMLALTFTYYRDVFEHFRQQSEGQGSQKQEDTGNFFTQSWDLKAPRKQKMEEMVKEEAGGESLTVDFTKNWVVGGQYKIYNSPTLPLHKDFYLTDEISRASRLMSLCSHQFSNLQKNFV